MRGQVLEPLLIAGGGIGGLAAAIALARNGIASHVIERRASFAEEGAGIQIGPNGTKVLAALGVDDLLRPHVAVPEALRILDAATGRELARFPLGKWIEARHGAPYWVAHRRDLHGALLERARAEPLIEITNGAEIATAETHATSVTARSPDGRAWSGPGLIAADGLWSELRATLFEARAPRYAGKSAFRTVLPRTAAPPGLQSNEVHLWLGRGVHVVHYPVRGGSEIAAVAIFDEAEATRDWSAPAATASMQARATSLADELGALLAAGTGWRKWSLHTLPLGPAFARGRVALLGDAAHPVLPFLAQGAVLALEDGLVLARAVTTHGGDIERAFAAFSRERRPRAAAVARASQLNGRVYHLSGVMAALRNGVFASIPGGRLMSAYDWLYGWTPEAAASRKSSR